MVEASINALVVAVVRQQPQPPLVVFTPPVLPRVAAAVVLTTILAGPLSVPVAVTLAVRGAAKVRAPLLAAPPLLMARMRLPLVQALLILIQRAAAPLATGPVATTGGTTLRLKKVSLARLLSAIANRTATMTVLLPRSLVAGPLRPLGQRPLFRGLRLL